LTSVSHLLDALEPDDRSESGELGVTDFFFGRSSRARGAVTFKVGRGRSTIRIFFSLRPPAAIVRMSE
jgi:hypothetical protein